MSFSISLNRCSPDSLSNSHLESLFATLEQYMAQEQFDKAVGELYSCFRHTQSEGEVQKCYQFLFELFSHCTSLCDLVENNLPNLLKNSVSFVKEQEQLALLLARRYLQKGNLKTAMLCFAKALQMNRSQDNYLAALEVFLLYFQSHKEQRLDSFLISSVPTPDTIASHIGTIKTLKALGIPKEDLIPFFERIIDRINTVPFENHDAYHTHEEEARNLRDSHWEPQKTAIERYWEALQTFRACFANQDARTVQKDAFNAMKQLIALCIEDICALIGSPPCHYDLRAMGSLGREEMCPYSDLEWMFLIENKQHRPYFERMLGLLELQIASFGETQGLPLVFTCLANPSGFHLDPSPLQEKRLMQTPGHMAQLQQRTTYAGNDIECTTLKTISLYQTTPQLYLEYQEHLKLIRKDFPFPFFNICKQRIRDFSLAWNHHFDRKTFTYNIKEQFVETLYHPLSDLALYLGINSTNTLEIADALIDRKVLPKKMRDLLKESISLIYQIRVRNHQQYGTQEDRAGLNSSEIDTLEKCYWQILIPLHTCLKKLIDPKEPHGQYFEELCRTKDTQALYVSQARQRQIEALPSESGPPSLNRKGDEEDRFGKVAAGQKSNLEAGWSITKQLNGAASILDAVLHLSDSSTTRPIYTVKMDALQASIIAITSPPSFSVPGEISVQIKAPYFPVVRSLWPPLTRKIMEGLDLKNDYSNSAHRVCRLQYGMHDLHLKQTPSNPLMEYAIHSLVSRIAGEYTPPTSLVRFDVEQQGQKKSYPVLISQTIPGETLKTAWPKATTNRSYTWNLLVAILIKPQDGRLSNYILHEQDLFCIDNDLAFVEPVIRSGLFRTVHFSAAPFCLFPLSTPLDQEVLKEFAALDAVGICKAWVEEVIEKEKEYIQLFTEEERKTLYQKEGCTLSILLKEGTFSTLNLQFWQLQNAIQAAINQNEILTAGDLLQQLVSLTNEKVGSYVYKAYNKTRPTPEKKQQAALRRRQDNSVTAVEYYKNCLGKIPSFDEIETLKKYSLQESSKELFHAFAIESEHAFWKNNQGKSALGVNFEGLNDPIRETKILLSMNEIMKDVYQKVFSLSFYFTKQLDTNTMRSFLHPNLEKIDLRSCENIDNNTVWLIQKECPILKELIVINCPKITGIGESFFSWLTFTHLETLVIAYTPCSKLLFKAPKLRLLNVSHNPKLVYLDFDAPLLFQIKAKGSEKIQFSDSAKESIVQALAKTPKNLATAHVSILSALEYASEELKNDKEFMLAAVQRYGSALQYASEELKSDKEFMLAVVERNGSAFLQYASEKLKSDKEFMLAAVQRYGSAIEYASEKLKSDKEFMLAAVQRYGSAIEYASEELKSDRDFVLAAAGQNRLVLKYGSEELKSDREIVLVALEQSGLALEYASEELKSDREIVLVALEQSGLALEYASEEFKSDREIVLAAVQRNGLALRYASEELKSDRDFVLAAAGQSRLALRYASEELKSDKDFMLVAVRQFGLVLEYASERLKGDKEIVLAAVQRYGSALEYASEWLKGDKEIVLAAVQQNELALRYASEELKSDREIVLAAVQQCGLALKYASDELKNDKDFMLVAVRQFGLLLEYASELFKGDREIVLAAVQQDGLALEYVSEALKGDKEIVLAAMQKNELALRYASKELKNDINFFH